MSETLGSADSCDSIEPPIAEMSNNAAVNEEQQQEEQEQRQQPMVITTRPTSSTDAAAAIRHNPSVTVQLPTSLHLAQISSHTNTFAHAHATAVHSTAVSTTGGGKAAELVRPLSTTNTSCSGSVQPKPIHHQQQRHHCHSIQQQQQQQPRSVPPPPIAPQASAASASASAGGSFHHSAVLASSYEDQRLTSITGPGSQYVKLNVGGSLHYTTIATLTKQPESMLRAMFSGRLEVLTDSEGWILIDRCGKHFPLILNYLRDSNVALPESRREVMEILAEAKYYCLQGLVDLCNAWLELSQKAEEEPTVCKIPIITTSKEEKALLQSTTRPVVKLLLNRHNNKYSYTAQSDDNLLKNLELFDKLVLRFNERVMFIKDVGAANEVCSWSFYGHGKKIGEVCCTSIVYATDKKHTKVEFPEARIYEEAMNILLYEPPIVCSVCQNVTCHASSCGAAGGDDDSPECASSSSPCCAGDCERVQLEKLQKARSAIRAAMAANNNRNECGGNSV